MIEKLKKTFFEEKDKRGFFRLKRRAYRLEGKVQNRGIKPARKRGAYFGVRERI